MNGGMGMSKSPMIMIGVVQSLVQSYVRLAKAVIDQREMHDIMRQIRDMLEMCLAKGAENSTKDGLTDDAAMDLMRMNAGEGRARVDLKAMREDIIQIYGLDHADSVMIKIAHLCVPTEW